jgi:hypothetical protein
MISSTKFFSSLLLAAAVLAPTLSHAAGERATKAEAEAMVAKGVAAVKSKGDAAYADITAPSKTFVDRDLYLVVYDNTGKCLAHGQNASGQGLDFFERP